MDPTTVASTAAATVITTWGIPGIIIVILAGLAGTLGWWLYGSLKAQPEQIRRDLEAKYADAAAGRDVLRELKTAIEMNTRTMETALTFLKGKI